MCGYGPTTTKKCGKTTDAPCAWWGDLVRESSYGLHALRLRRGLIGKRRCTETCLCSPYRSQQRPCLLKSPISALTIHAVFMPCFAVPKPKCTASLSSGLTKVETKHADGANKSREYTLVLACTLIGRKGEHGKHGLNTRESHRVASHLYQREETHPGEAVASKAIPRRILHRILGRRDGSRKEGSHYRHSWTQLLRASR